MIREALRRVFLNPPKGGNEVGVATASSMQPVPGPLATQSRIYSGLDGGKNLAAQREEREVAKMSPERAFQHGMDKWEEQRRKEANPSGPGAQTSLQESFEAGEASSRARVLQSGRVGQPEMRNYDRARFPFQPAADPERLQMYDHESNEVGMHGNVGEVAPPPPQANPGQRPIPQIRPDTTMPARSDGKPYKTMGVKPSGNSPTFTSDRDRDDDDIDRNGGI